jgi:hypothetical protein
MRKATLRRALKFLGLLIDERLEQENQYGRKWAGRPVGDSPLFSSTLIRSRTILSPGFLTPQKVKNARHLPSLCASL